MIDHTHKVIESVGTSSSGITQAIEDAVSRAAETSKGLGWFEVHHLRGKIEDGRVTEYEAEVKVGLRV